MLFTLFHLYKIHTDVYYIIYYNIILKSVKQETFIINIIFDYELY